MLNGYAREKYASPAGDSGQLVSAQRTFDSLGSQRITILYRILVHGAWLPRLQTHPDRTFSTVLRSQVFWLQSGLDEKFHGGLRQYIVVGDACRPKDFCMIGQKRKDAGGEGSRTPPKSHTRKTDVWSTLICFADLCPGHPPTQTWFPSLCPSHTRPTQNLQNRI